MSRPWLRAPLAALAVACAPGGCAIMQPAATPRALPTELRLGRLGEQTAFETGPANNDADALAPRAGADVEDNDFAGDTAGDTSEERAQRQRKVAFAVGIILGAVGTAATVGVAAAGQAKQNELADAYDSSLTRQEEGDLNDQGKTLNRVAIGSAVVGVVGLAIAMIALGIDYNQCGKIVKKRRKACAK